LVLAHVFGGEWRKPPADPREEQARLHALLGELVGAGLVSAEDIAAI
jgi:hypothetical protein